MAVEIVARHIDELQRKLRKTGGNKKLVQYVEEMFKSDYFETKKLELRKKYKIPKNGFPQNDHFPLFPMEWEYRKDLEIIGDLKKEIKAVCQKFHLHYMDWSWTIEEKIFYDKYTLEFDGFNSHNLCIVADVAEEYPHGKEYRESDDTAYQSRFELAHMPAREIYLSS